MTLYSIRKLSLNYSLVAVTLVVVLTVTSYFVVRENLKQQNYNSHILSLSSKAENISNQLAFHRNIVSKMAKQKQLVDMILFYGNDEIQVWANTMRELLPDNIGLALFDESGRILGNPVSLRLGDQCVADIRSLLHAERVGNPPVHRKVRQFEHYDIVEKVYHEDELAGMVFVSFSLNPLHAEIDRMTDIGQRLILTYAKQRPISDSNKLTGKPIEFRHSIKIKHSDWVLYGEFEQQNLNTLIIILASVNLFMFILVSLVLFAYSRRLLNLIMEDFKAIQEFLIRVKKRVNNPGKIRFSGLPETRDIVKNIQHLADDISELVDTSTTDELTGIYNRRGFNKHIGHYIQLAHRQVNVCVVVLDIDHFKLANDKHGHLFGDEVLKILAQTFTETTRETDIFARLGGDEFAAILINSHEDDVLMWYERLSAQFRRHQQKQLTDLAPEEEICTISAGYTQILSSDQTQESILLRADTALYEAKSGGKDNIKAFQAGPS